MIVCPRLSGWLALSGSFDRLTETIQIAMCHAHYEILDGDGGYYGEIPGFHGVFADADTLFIPNPRRGDRSGELK